MSHAPADDPLRAPRDALARLGLELPTPLTPPVSFVPYTLCERLLHVSGQLPFEADGALSAVGRVGAEIDLALAQRCAQRAALHLLAQIEQALGSLELVERILKVHVYVASAPSFTEQHLVANGASDLLLDVLGEAGHHARSAFGVVCLPFGSPVELDAVVAVKTS
jgi:enamine deaminase RidA (YjgF/YER057c/UK114 family)